MKITPVQRRAINHTSGNLQLIACAGSGKTEVVARHIVELLKSERNSVQPRNVVAFTFTDKAAAELKERIYKCCAEELGEVHGLAEMYIGTIHAFALELIQSEIPKYMRYEVLNEVQQILFVDRHSKACGLTATKDLKGRLLRRYIDTDLYVSALSILRESDFNEDKLKGHSIRDGLQAYQQLLDEKSYLDYSAILVKAVDGLTNEKDLRKRIADRVHHIIVDEYQDVNPIQEGLILLFNKLGANLCVVGDDDQTIYQWRGSDVTNIISFEKRYPNVKQVRLEDNFRSSKGIIETSRSFIEQNQERLPKAMESTDAQIYETGDIVALPFDSADTEARYIANTIRKLRGVIIKDGESKRGISWSDMAILLRSVKHNGETITQALDTANIPYVVIGMNNLFSTTEAEAARQLFYYMAGGIDRETLKIAWLKAKTGSSKDDIEVAIRNATKSRADMAKENGERWGFYSIQRQFLKFLEDAAIREEHVPGGRGEVLFYNLGKFSQLISDFESIHYHSEPSVKYDTFANFLKYRAENSYPEGWQDNQYTTPDAVQVMTVHQAKGMQWPVVFVPALLRNRFPSKKQGGRSVWHIIPPNVVKGHERFEGTIEDERRLLYVAMTRSQKYLFLTWGPIEGYSLYQKPSEFWEDVLRSKWVKRRQYDYSTRERTSPTPKANVENVVLSFSDLKYFFECPYQFKLRILYGFNAPIHEALGYGKSLHNILAEIHARAFRGDIAADTEVPKLIEQHLHTPYAYPKLRENLTKAAEHVVADYLKDNRDLFKKIEFFEKPVEINLDGGVSIMGRIDLVRRVDTGETTIVDLKSTNRAQAEDVTEMQLHIYALGYEELTGRRADMVEIYNLDERKRKQRSVDDDFMKEVKENIYKAAKALRTSELQKNPHSRKCAGCDYRGMCAEGSKLQSDPEK